MEFNDIKITVIKKIETGDIFDNYAVGEAQASCPAVQVGDEFMSKKMAMPDGFCSWAWADFQRDVVHLAMGGDFPWMKEKGKMITCCTDGLRPVLFKLERL